MQKKQNLKQYTEVPLLGYNPKNKTSLISFPPCEI